MLVATVAAACSSEPQTSPDPAPSSAALASERVHPADVPCVNERADEVGAPVPADDIYVDDEVLDWPRADPGEAGFDAALLDSAVHDVGLSSTVLSLLVAREGRLVVEEYFNGAEASHAHNIFSMTKLLTTLAMGAAAAEGLVGGLDTTLGEWVGETAGTPAAAITLEQLLAMRSGLAPAVEPNEPFSVDALAPLEADPGSTYAYVTENTELLALGLDRRAPDGLCRFLHRRVLSPLGVSIDHWHETPYGNVTGGSYAFATPRELARLGQLLLDGGRADGEHLVESSWVDAMTDELSDFGCEVGNMARSPRSILSGRGMVPWYEIAGYEVWESGGYGGQAILVVPDLELVVVITQEVGPVFERRLSILDVLEYAVLPALIDPPEGPAPCPTAALVHRSTDGTERLLSPASQLFSDWAPDGTQLVFGSDNDLNPELYVIDADGTDLRRLTDHGATDALPRWSPDGTHIAFVSDRGAEHRTPVPELDLWLLDPDTSEARPLTEGFGDVLGHSWSPEGDQIVFTRTPEATPFGDLWLVDVETGETELLLEGEFALPEWSPDGESIAYTTTRDGEPFVSYLNLTSGDHIDLAPGEWPRWSPNGDVMLVTRAGSIITIDLDTRVEDVITEGCCASVGLDGHLVVHRDS